MKHLERSGNQKKKTHFVTGEALLAWDLYIVRTSTIAKNMRLNIVLQVELYLRTGTYDRLKNTAAIDSACAPLDSAPGDACPAPLHCFESRMDDR